MIAQITVPVQTTQELPDNFLVGFNAYCDGAEYKPDAPSHYLAGWWAALNAQAEAEMPSEYEDDMLDREFWSRGQW